MPFCSKCGTEVPEGVNFCSKCGNAVQVGQSSQTPPSPERDCFGNALQQSPVSDKWVWTLACVPILGMILERTIAYIIGSNSEALGFIPFIALNIIFVILDTKELEKKGYNPGGWIWLGLLLIPVYLFIRASNTNKKYGYAIAWCVLFVLSCLL